MYPEVCKANRPRLCIDQRPARAINLQADRANQFLRDIGQVRDIDA